jgi:tol-pal system-associated acyl-CoA thioesterase
MQRAWNHDVQIYYEDTDHSGAVYHANYLRYFERAREHMLGVDALVRLGREDGIGFVVYKASLHYRAPAEFGDTLSIRSTVTASSAFRLTFEQRAHILQRDTTACEAVIELACVDRAQQLVKVPPEIREALLQASSS